MVVVDPSNGFPHGPAGQGTLRSRGKKALAQTGGQGIWGEPLVPCGRRQDHGHPMVDASHVGTRCGGEDRGLNVLTESFPDAGKGQGVAIHLLEVKGLTITRSPLVKAAGGYQAPVQSEGITEAREGLHGLAPGIEERGPARGGESPDGRIHVPPLGISPHDGNG